MMLGTTSIAQVGIECGCDHAKHSEELGESKQENAGTGTPPPLSGKPQPIEGTCEYPGRKHRRNDFGGSPQHTKSGLRRVGS